ncbi:MAG: hypothetical protein JWM73_1879 [Solirubrobacterales bacterium]|nr:hypothetical protein [Solirubrobacterales bacterium]
MSFPRAALAASLAVAALAPAAASADPTVPAGPDAFTSPNVEYLGSIKEDVGMTTGARVVGNRLFVTSAKNISVYDITNPADPKRVGNLRVNMAWENEEVPTNGKILGYGSDFFNATVDGGCVQALAVDGCTQFFDVRDPSNIKALPAVPTANHTVECVLDCTWFYGSAGSIIDARGALDGKAPKEVGNWKTEAAAQGVTEKSCHHVREISPGIVLTACQPFTVMSVLESDGGSPDHPKVLYTGAAAKFVHSARWPRQGTDDLALIGGEQNFTGRCERNNSEFSTYSAKAINEGESTEFQGPLDQIVPTNGVYADGHAPAGELGCSVHWFQEHPSFHNGGLVALSEYENGVRFEQVGADGKITEQGYFIAVGSSSSSPKWAPDGKTVYSIDYHRGIDILRYNGDTYVPNAAGKVKHSKGKVRGTNGAPIPARVTARLSRFDRSGILSELRAAGWVPNYCRLIARRES